MRERQDLSPGSGAAFFSFISFLVSVFPYRTVALPFPVVPLILIPLPFLMLGVLPSLDGLSFHGAAFEHARTHNQPLAQCADQGAADHENGRACEEDDLPR
mgnify:CR=1 FL=1